MGMKFSTRLKYSIATSVALGMILSYQATVAAAEPVAPRPEVTQAAPALAEGVAESTPASSAAMPAATPQVAASEVSEAPEVSDLPATPAVEATTPAPAAEAPNLVPGATITYQSVPDQGQEGAAKMLNGTKNGLSDKFYTAKDQVRVDIKLDKPHKVIRWVVEHAGAGGEATDMNTRDFDLIFKDLTTKNWKLAKSIRGNQESVTDVLLDRPFESDEWGLYVKTPNNGSSHPGVRIYNWKMYEVANPATPALRQDQVSVDAIGTDHVQVAIKNVPANATVTLYDNAKVRKIVATGMTTQAGDLLLPPVKVTQDIHQLYYRVQTPGLAQSAVGQIDVPKKVDWRITQMDLHVDQAKRLYKVGEQLDFTNTSLAVRYYGNFNGKVFDLTNPAVTIKGFDNQRPGQQDLEISFLGEVVRLPWKVYVYQPAPDNARKVIGMDVVRMPIAEYVQGQDLDLVSGRFRLLYSDGTSLLQPFIHRRVVYSGYDKNKLGKQRVTMTYKNEIISHFDVMVLPRDVIDFTRLNALIAEAEATLRTGVYQYASFGNRIAVDHALSQAKAAVKSPFTRVNQEEGARWTLYGALRRLDGATNKAVVLKDFNALIQRGENIMSRYPNNRLYPAIAKAVAEAKALLPLDVILGRDIDRLTRELKDLLAWF